jgi:DNA-binding transcriptional ArsR family regulator
VTIALALRERGDLRVCDLAWITGRAENLVGHHLRTLGDAGLAPAVALRPQLSEWSNRPASASGTVSMWSRPSRKLLATRHEILTALD